MNLQETTIFRTEAPLAPAAKPAACLPLSRVSPPEFSACDGSCLAQAPHLLWTRPTPKYYLMWRSTLPSPSPQLETSLRGHSSPSVTSGIDCGPCCVSMIILLLSLPILTSSISNKLLAHKSSTKSLFHGEPDLHRETEVATDWHMHRDGESVIQ